MSKENSSNNGNGGPQREHMAKVYTSKRLHKGDHSHSRFTLITKFDEGKRPLEVIIDRDIGLFE